MAFFASPLLSVVSLLLLLYPAATAAQNFGKRAVGINYGRVADNLPAPDQAIKLIQSVNASSVRIYDADATVLTELAGTGLDVTVTIPNDQIPILAEDSAEAATWVNQNVVAYRPDTLITTIVAGNELLSPSTDFDTLATIVPAMQNVQAALVAAGLADDVNVTTSLAMDVLATSYPPDAAVFADAVAPAVVNLLGFLHDNNSFLMINVYPFLAWESDPDNFNLTFALVDGDGYVNGYTWLLDAMIDAVYAAAARVGYADVSLVVGETGWPSAGQDQATVENAATYNTRVVTRVIADPPPGTPLKPGVFIPITIFALFNEDLTPGVETERNWGLFYPNGTAVYNLDLSGTGYTNSARLSSRRSHPISSKKLKKKILGPNI